MDAERDARVGRRQVRSLALALTVLALVVVAISAYVRLHAAGLGCENWPACYGEILSGRANAHVGLARLLHRLGASAALVLALVLAWRAMQPQPLQPAARRSVALVALMIVLAAIGIWSADPHRAWAVFLNILGGLALVTLSWRVVLSFEESEGSVADPWRTAALTALLPTMALGALIGARYAAPACATLPLCGAGLWPDAGWGALNPFVANLAPMAPGNADGIALHLGHRYAALATLVLLAVQAHRGLRVPERRTAARAVLGLLAVEVALGGLTVASGFSLWLGIAHSVCAAALLAIVAGGVGGRPAN